MLALALALAASASTRVSYESHFFAFYYYDYYGYCMYFGERLYVLLQVFSTNLFRRVSIGRQSHHTATPRANAMRHPKYEQHSSEPNMNE